MRRFHCTWTLAALLALPVSAQQAPPAPAPPKPVGYTVFLRGAVVGHQDVSVRSDATGLVITGQGQIADPIDVLTRKVEIHYRADLSPASLTIDSRIGGVDVALQTDFNAGTAVSKGTQGTAPIAATEGSPHFNSISQRKRAAA